MPINRLVTPLRWHPLTALLAAALFTGTLPALAALDPTDPTDPATQGQNTGTTTGPVRLGTNPARPQQTTDDSNRSTLLGDDTANDTRQDNRQRDFRPTKPLVLSEFETYVSELAGVPIQRLGSDLMLPSRGITAIEANRQVPPDYVVGLGDEIQLTIWGSVDADLRLTVDRAGRIVIPRVGPVVVAGVRHADLNELLTRRVGQVFKNFQLSATLGRLRSIRYYVTGFVARPGAYSVSSLATVMTGLVQAGGPSAAGSFRNIELRRNGQTVGHFDLYDLLVRGDKKGDLPLQADDVLYIGPQGQRDGQRRHRFRRRPFDRGGHPPRGHRAVE
jgi:protein involved in polysaccharide export with SLBB domain